MNSIYLFCGGNKNYSNGKSKPLQKYVNDDELILVHYHHIKNYFDKITYIIEDDEFEFFNETTSNIKDNINIFRARSGTSTLQKLEEIINTIDEEFASFSYPDIFCGADFWKISKYKDFTITRISISSRFPRIYSDIFTDTVKGISNYQSRVPANPHYIFGGKFDFNVNKLKKFMLDFEVDGKTLEVDFLDDLALKKSIYAKTIYEEWFNIDSARDYTNMLKFYGNGS
jgi:hypothetical protein